jgi:ferredoxin
MTQYKVWIDSDLCTGDGLCEEICPEIFVVNDDGLWVVKEEAKNYGEKIVFDGKEGKGHGPRDSKGLARIPDRLLDSAIEAADECPGFCIFISEVSEDE